MATYTAARLQITKEAFDEIYRKLEAAGYNHAFNTTGETCWIDMSGIALESKPYLSTEAQQASRRPPNYWDLSPQEQWEIDKDLGILDWEGA